MLKLQNKITLNKETILCPNLTKFFTDQDIKTLGRHVMEGFVSDKQSRMKWEKRNNAALNLALQVVEGKSFPWAGCSNVAFPLVTIAALQFHSRAYPAIIPGSQIVQYRVLGDDPDGTETSRARRIGEYMSWQLLEDDSAWEEGQDRALISLPIVGTVFKKSYRCNSKTKSELVLANDLVMDYYTRSVETCARKTQIIPMYRNEIYTNVRTGIFRNILNETWYAQNAIPLTDNATMKQDKRTGELPPVGSDSTPFTMLEQHCWLDLDNDGYAEPYIATIEYQSSELVRLVARVDREVDIVRNMRGEVVTITATEYFTKYGFIPSPDGSIYDIGFGVLLGPLNETVNSIVNQLVDAGTMANTAGGFLGRGAKMRGGAYTFAPFSWQRVDSTGDDLRKNIFPMPVRDPSSVLFQLLSLIIGYADRIPGSTETMMGENPGQNTPASTMQTMVDQGSKVYAAIFKRTWRSMKDEFKKIFILNAVHMNDQVNYGTNVLAYREDFLGDPSRIAPVADPHIVSESQRIQQAMLLTQRAAVTAGYDREEVECRFLQAIRVDGLNKVYPGLKAMPPSPSEKIQIEQMKLQAKQQHLQLQQQQFAAQLQDTMRLTQAKIMELTAKAALEIEQADGVKDGHALALFDAELGAMRAHHDIVHEQFKLVTDTIQKEREHELATKQLDQPQQPN